ncbi:MAG: transcription-repair coupling factor [Candidatus Omnitrophica bacterium]|nr:transcription-repair coupling factor [Candidatus Omnitrophota bacterium]MDD5236833.1 transcription-repair coupling factor [Candidatus Omnitrophota bacterium]MDD5611226.1 transcription-repair coupling factor [Candidatus Omnitrophota bacterium]
MFKAIKLYLNQEISLDSLLSLLLDSGYKRQERVSEESDFALRGGILDIFPLTFELPIRIELEQDKIVSIKSFDPVTGKSAWAHQMVIILPIRRLHPTKIKTLSEELPVDNFLDIKPLDYVVHVDHGIGKFLGVNKIKAHDGYKDHLVIEYDRQEKLYVPMDQIHLVQKYISFSQRKHLKLSRLGSKEWQRIKSRVKKGIQKLALDLLALQAMRMSVKGFSFSGDNEWQKEFEGTFPYRETADQAKAVAEVKNDMQNPKPMDRLLCGDVGYGKTEVAMRAAFKAVLDDKQVAFLVPTTILAEQHYQNFISRIRNFPVNIAMLSRFQSVASQKNIIQDMAKGKVDVLIGTHRLLSPDIKFKDLGLLIIDEEQRFGVKAKEHLKSMKLTTDVLTLTATPIPRTLYMSLMGVKDLSIINTPPQNRLSISTHVVEYDEDLIRQALNRELSRKGQVYFVHNRVLDIEKIAKKVSALSPKTARISIAHGQMHSRELEHIMLDFLKGNIDVLVCTTIIQSGIDVPNANTLIINEADEFGLADLHQLRGRVGRFDRPAYAYFMVRHTHSLSLEAKKRLDALIEYSQLGSGFKIAMEDLEIRGAGNLLGYEQHGFIMAVGFDLYCRLLRESVGSLKKISGTGGNN